MPKRVLSNIEAQLQQVRTAVLNELAPGSVLHLGGKPYTPAQLTAEIDAWLALFAASAAARTQLSAAVRALREALPAERTFVRDLLQSVIQRFGQGSPTVVAFGIRPPKVASPLSPGRKALSVAKAQATRKLRGTLSRKQRSQIAGAPSPAQLLLGSDGHQIAGGSGTVGPRRAAEAPPTKKS